jgi:hypothetical protein
MADWNLAKVWNASLDVDRQREYEPRDYIWASELGGSYYDRYWKMKGRKPTTPPNQRAKRKFEAGNLSEWVVLQVLRRAELLQTTQQHITFDNGVMKVTGRCDFVAGGRAKLDDLSDLPEGLSTISQAVLERLHEGGDLDERILELKSCSGIMFERYISAPAKYHALQLFHYVHNLQKSGRLVYLSRDDLRMVEWTIAPDSKEWQELYEQDISKMAEVYKLPEKEIEKYKEPLLVFEDNKFKKNFRVEYSNYLTDYGYKRPDQYAEPAGKLAGRINRVITRINEGKKLTKLNEEAIKDVIKFYPSAEEKINELKEVANGNSDS